MKQKAISVLRPLLIVIQLAVGAFVLYTPFGLVERSVDLTWGVLDFSALFLGILMIVGGLGLVFKTRWSKPVSLIGWMWLAILYIQFFVFGDLRLGCNVQYEAFVGPNGREPSCPSWSIFFTNGPGITIPGFVFNRTIFFFLQILPIIIGAFFTYLILNFSKKKVVFQKNFWGKILLIFFWISIGILLVVPGLYIYSKYIYYPPLLHLR